jgi:hypothetical protein
MDMGLSRFPGTMAAAPLTYLNLRGNDFSAIPESVYQLSTLRVLNLSYIEGLQLFDRNVDALVAMPHRDTPNQSGMRKGSSFSVSVDALVRACVRAMMALNFCMPHLGITSFTQSAALVTDTTATF